jgi:hypothetical protein
MVQKLCSWFILGGTLLFLTACESDEKNARVQIWLTDAPGDYQEVNVNIAGVEIHSSDTDDEKGWNSLPVNGGVYNLLELTNGVDTLLAEKEIPAGKISQIRLKLSDGNTIKINDEVFDLDIPSGQQSGLKLQVHETLVEGVTYKILLDFDVARSVILTGTGAYKLKPVIRTITEAQNGAIKGSITPEDSNPAIYAIAGQDTLGTTYSDSTGHFLLRGIPAGSYKLLFVPATGYQVVEKNPVTVQTGVVSYVGVVTIPEN